MNIDDLLAEMDSAMNDTPKTRPKNITTIKPAPVSIPVVSKPVVVESRDKVSTPISKPSSDLNDIDSLLYNMSLATDGINLNKQAGVKPATTSVSSKPRVTPTTSAEPTKSSLFSMSTSCNPLILYGKQPVQTSSLPPTCTHIHCIQCSHDVICLPGQKWSNVDYFFFRNAMPNLSQLQTGAIADPSTSAYCCQCAWMNVNTQTNITAAQSSGRTPYNQEKEATPQQVRWICSKSSKF